MQALQHPYLVSLRYAFQTENKLFIVLDYLNGGELFFHLKVKTTFFFFTGISHFIVQNLLKKFLRICQ